MRKVIILISILLCWIKGQAIELGRDSTQIQDIQVVNDSVLLMDQILEEPHSPHRATIMAMILPGSGQVYNDQWWKVPILYAGIAADIYGIAWNQSRFTEYRDAYVEWVVYTEALAANPDTPYPENPAWNKIQMAFDPETDLPTPEEKEWFKDILNNRKTSFKRNRDLCYILMAVIYAVNIIDATVYAHFYDFEIDDDLSLNLQPTTSYSPISGGTVGLTLTFNF